MEQSGRNRRQPVETGRNRSQRDGAENGSNRQKPLPWVVTSCRGLDMVSRGSAVRVGQRALQAPQPALFRYRGLARSPACGGYGAVWSSHVQRSGAIAARATRLCRSRSSGDRRNSVLRCSRRGAPLHTGERDAGSHQQEPESGESPVVQLIVVDAFVDVVSAEREMKDEFVVTRLHRAVRFSERIDAAARRGRRRRPVATELDMPRPRRAQTIASGQAHPAVSEVIRACGSRSRGRPVRARRPGVPL